MDFYLIKINKSPNKLPNILDQLNSAVKWSNWCIVPLQIISAAGTYKSDLANANMPEIERLILDKISIESLH